MSTTPTGNKENDPELNQRQQKISETEKAEPRNDKLGEPPKTRQTFGEVLLQKQVNETNRYEPESTSALENVEQELELIGTIITRKRKGKTETTPDREPTTIPIN